MTSYAPTQQSIEDIVPKKDVNLIIMGRLDPNSPMVSDAFRTYVSSFRKMKTSLPAHQV